MSQIDFSYLRDISDGDEEFIKEMVETFINETPKDIALMQTSFNSRDWVEVGKTAHKLKSSIKMFGFADLKDQAFFIEQAGKNGTHQEELPQKVEVFIKDLNQAIEDLKKHL